MLLFQQENYKASTGFFETKVVFVLKRPRPKTVKKVSIIRRNATQNKNLVVKKEYNINTLKLLNIYEQK